MEKLDQSVLFKKVMGSYPTGVTVVTTSDHKNNPVGMTVNSFASVSLDPLLVLWCIDHNASAFNTFKNTDKFAIHILAGNQQELCRSFASKDIDRFNNCKWSFSAQQLPIIQDVFGIFHCKTFNKIEAGDHTILIGEVFDIDVGDKEPMLYHQRHFGPIPSNFLDS